jgi:hypothetical protein
MGFVSKFYIDRLNLFATTTLWSVDAIGARQSESRSQIARYLLPDCLAPTHRKFKDVVVLSYLSDIEQDLSPLPSRGHEFLLARAG